MKREIGVEGGNIDRNCFISVMRAVGDSDGKERKGGLGIFPIPCIHHQKDVGLSVETGVQSDALGEWG